MTCEVKAPLIKGLIMVDIIYTVAQIECCAEYLILYVRMYLRVDDLIYSTLVCGASNLRRRRGNPTARISTP